MTHEIADQDVGDVVCRIIAEALARDVEVRLTSNLMEDLGAESIDFLDIVFKIEQTFGIKITRGEMEKAAKGDMSDDEFAPAGVISKAGLERLRALMPEAADRIHEGLRPMQILSLFSAQTFVNIVMSKRGGLS